MWLEAPAKTFLRNHDINKTKLREWAGADLCVRVSDGMFGILGLVVDVGWGHFKVEAAQTAADAAASAAAGAALPSSGQSLIWGTNNVACQSTTVCPNPIPVSPVKNIDIACAYANSIGFAITDGGRQNVTVAAGTGAVPTASGITPPYWVTVWVAETIPQLFSVVLGNKTGLISARAHDRHQRESSGRLHLCSEPECEPRLLDNRR